MLVMMMGFSESEARLGLRACQGDIQRAVAHIVQRREVRGHDQDLYLELDKRSLTDYVKLMKLISCYITNLIKLEVIKNVFGLRDLTAGYNVEIYHSISLL